MKDTFLFYFLMKVKEVAMADVVEILRIEGIMAQGFGLSPKIVMRDRRLSIEAKSIYCYLASYAGGGNQAFPSRDTILADLNISKNRYYKHFKQLVDCDYIRIERTKAVGNLYNRNIYTIVAAPAPEMTPAVSEGQIKPELPGELERERLAGAGGKDKPKRRSAGKEISAGTELPEGTGMRSSAEDLAEQLQIKTLKQQHPDAEPLIEEILLAVEDIALSDQIAIGKTVKPKAAINALLAKLTVDHVSLVLTTMRKNNRKLINRKAYIQTCIFNSIFDINNNNTDKIPAASNSESRAEEEKRQEEQNRKELYERSPELKALDHEIGKVCAEMSKAILQGNEIQHKKLLDQKSQMESRRSEMIENLDVSVLKTSGETSKFELKSNYTF